MTIASYFSNAELTSAEQRSIHSLFCHGLLGEIDALLINIAGLFVS